MKKTLALLLAVLTVFSSMVFAVAAEDAGESAAKAKFVMISDGSSADGWSDDRVNNPLCTYNAEEGCMEYPVSAYSFELAKVKIMYKTDKTYDISKMEYLCFDLYIEDVAAVTACNWELELRSPGANDDTEMVIKGASLLTLANGMLVNGWNHFQIPLNSFVESTKEGTSAAKYDKSKWNYFRLFNSNTQPVGTNKETKLKIKNLYFTDTALAEKTTEGELYFGVKSENPYHSDQNDYIRTYIQENTAPGACLKMTTKAYYGNDNSKLDEFIKKNDISQYKYLVFDVKIANALLNTVSFNFELTSSGGSDSQELGVDKKLSEIAGEELVADKWYRLYLPISQIATSYGGTLDKTKWNFFRIYNNSIGNLDSDNDTNSRYDITFNGFHFSEAKEPSASEILVWDAESTKFVTLNQPSAYSPKDESNKQILMDFDNDNDNEWVIVNQTAGTEAADRTMYPGGGWQVESKGIKGGVKFTNGIDTHSKFAGIKFDIYVSDTTTKTVTGSKDSGWTTSNSETSILDQTFFIEITSSGTCDQQEKSWHGTLRELFGNDFKAGEWVTVSLDINEAQLTSESKWSETAGTADDKWTFNPQGVNYIRIYNDSAFEWSGTLTIAIDNLYAVRDLSKDETTNNASAKVSGVALALTDAFELNYTVTADSAVASEPIMDVTFHGETKRVQLSANATGKYTYTFDGILPQYLVDKVKTTVYALDQNGGLLKSTHEYSVKDYCIRMLRNDGKNLGLLSDQKTALNQLLSDVLHYGAAAQTYAGYNTENLATSVGNSTVLNEPRTGVTFTGLTDKLIDGDKGSYEWKAATLVLDSTMLIRYYFTVADDATKPTIKCADGNTYQGTFLSEEVTVDGAPMECYYVDLPVYAGDFATAYKLHFGDNDSYTVTYSVNHYIASNYDKNSEKPDLQALMAAIYNYGVSVTEYQNAMTPPSSEAD